MRSPWSAKTTFDAMGLTVQADTILASGHPDPANQDHTFTAPNVGLVRYSDAGWEQVSLAGVTDFHLLAATPAAPDFLLGLPSDRAVLAASTDAGQTWTDVGPLTARDISIDTMQADIVTATTPDGLMVSRDGGTTFSAVANAPALLVITRRPDGGGRHHRGRYRRHDLDRKHNAGRRLEDRRARHRRRLRDRRQLRRGPSRSPTRAESASPPTPGTPGDSSSERTPHLMSPTSAPHGEEKSNERHDANRRAGSRGRLLGVLEVHRRIDPAPPAGRHRCRGEPGLPDRERLLRPAADLTSSAAAVDHRLRLPLRRAVRPRAHLRSRRTTPTRRARTTITVPARRPYPSDAQPASRPPMRRRTITTR